MGAGKVFLTNLKEKGFNQAVKRTLRYLCGLDDNIDTLHYILNRLVDVRSFPKAEGSLRELQLCDTELLKIFHAFCEKEKLEYWIDYGTLLGAVRHGGFLPWDDDVDIAMERKVYDQAYPILRNGLSKYGIDVHRSNGHIGIGYKHKDTGVWIDVFPIDLVKVNGGIQESSGKINKCFEKIRKKCKKNGQHINDEDFLAKESIFRNKCIQGISDADGDEVMVHGVETFLLPIKYCSKHSVYPRQKILFEDFELYAPSDAADYLNSLYGNDFMLFPKTGVEHHDGDTGIQVSKWSTISNINMNDVRTELSEIYNAVKE